jgi:hypothetical protein
MSAFDYRLSFKLPLGDHINFDGEELELIRTSSCRVHLRSGARGTPIKGHSQAAIIGGSYGSRDEAIAAAGRAREALLIWAVTHRTGVDLGDGRARGVLTEYGKKLLEEQLGSPVRNSIHGTDVYEAQEGLVFVSLNAEAAVGRNADAFRAEIGGTIADPMGLSEKQLLAAELYCASHFDLSVRSRFITLVTAVETLLQPARRSEDVQAFVTACQARLDGLQASQETKHSLRSAMEWLKSDSIGHAGRLLSQQLLGDREYQEMTSTKFFTSVYSVRSEIVHNGKPSDPAINLSDLAVASQQFVADLLLASFYQARGAPKSH